MNHTGILILKGNKSYGRTKNNRLLYKCVPNNKDEPLIFLTYEIQMGFSKVYTNKLVIYKHVTDKNSKINRGTIVESIGDVDNLECYNRYQIYSKNLFHSIQPFQQKIHSQKSVMSIDKVSSKFPNIENRINSETQVITIDSKNTLDIDDGLSCVVLPNGNTRISVHITNPYVWFETFELWGDITGRVSSIYLPEKRVPMLPTNFTENYGSLKEGSQCFSLTMDIEFDNTYNMVTPPTFHTTLIQIYKNHCYEDDEILDTHLFQFSKKIDPTIKDTYGLVSYWMVRMNSCSALFLRDMDKGIFRLGGACQTPHPFLGKESIPVLKTKLSTKLLEEEDINQPYVYITSPLRRIIDLYNISVLSIHLFNEVGSVNCSAFLDKIETQISQIENDFRSIRKIQFESKLLYTCFEKPEILTQSYEGKVMEVTEKGASKYKSIIYIGQLKLYSFITTVIPPILYNTYQFRIFTFQDENTTKRKIRISITE